jgi:hypothetical protein
MSSAARPGVAARLCEAEYALFFKMENGNCHMVASNNATAALVKYVSEHPRRLRHNPSPDLLHNGWSMKLIFLHGPPASGKLTIAKALLRSVPGRPFDNHAAIDLARTVFDFGTAGFWELVQTVRISILHVAAEKSVPLIVMTFVYVEPDDLPAFEQYESVVQRRGGQLLPVFLQCSGAEIIRRIGNVDRADRGKMTSEQGVRDFLASRRCRGPTALS